MPLIHLPSVSPEECTRLPRRVGARRSSPNDNNNIELVVLREPKLFHHSRVPVRVYTHIAPVGIYPETIFRIDSLLYCYVFTHSFILYQHITTNPFSVIILGVGSVTIFREPVIRYPVILRTYRLSPGLPPRPEDAAT